MFLRRVVRDLLKLLEASDRARHRRIGKERRPRRYRHLPYIDAPLRIHRQPVRREKLPGSNAGGRLPADSREQFTLAAVNAQPGPKIGCPSVEAQIGADFTNIAMLASSRWHVHATRTVHVVPLGLEPPITVKHLDTMVLSVCDIDPAILIARDVVGTVELPGIGARLAPRHYAFAVWSIFVDPRVPVAV